MRVWVAGGFLVLVCLAAIFPGVLTPGDPMMVNPDEALAPPGWGHVLGTDASGRDVFTRVVYGTGESVGIALGATGIGVGLATVLGFASLAGQWVDAVVSRVVEVLFSLPTLVLALLLVAVMGPGVKAVVIAVGLATAPGYARIVRTQATGVASSGYVRAARADGVGPVRVFLRHILPNTAWPLVSLVTLGVGQAIVWVAGLSFLGLGALPPSPEWGALLTDGRTYITSAWWLTLAPGLAIMLTALATTVLGRAGGQRQVG